jgi:poly-gamma-glutamate synthesis protein (capsule biosynthesis protein)
MFSYKYLLLPLFFLFFIAGCAEVRTQNPAAEILAPVAQEQSPGDQRDFTLVAGGDVAPAHHLSPYFSKHGWDYPYQAISPYFQKADIGLVNLECPLSLRGRRLRGKKYTFCGPPEAAAALKKSGINAVSLANNHAMDFVPQALYDTLRYLDQAGISRAGAGMNAFAAHRPARIEIVDGPVVALLSYTLTFPEQFWATRSKPGTALARLEQIQAEITATRTWAGLTIVCFHWGRELELNPRPYQTEFGRAAINAGAQVVIGTHPHVLQGVEFYKNGVIFYSLGNLAFGGGQSRSAVLSGLAKITFDRSGTVKTAEILPLNVDNAATQFQPKPLAGHRAEMVFQLLRDHSKPWETRFQPKDSGWCQVLPQETLPVEAKKTGD